MLVVKGRPGLDDPVWQYLLQTRLEQYIPAARKWWEEVEHFEPTDTGVYEIPDSPPGMRARFTRTAIRSPFKGIQAFPFVPTAYLQLSNVQGGANKLVTRTCPFEIEEFTIVSKSLLPSTYAAGQFIAFIPTDIWTGVALLGRWLYLTAAEITDLANGIVPDTVKAKGRLKV